jgi:hypothetical protein
MKTLIARLFVVMLGLMVGASVYAASAKSDVNQKNSPAPSQSSEKKSPKADASSATAPDESGVVVFNNTMNYLGEYFYSPNEFGDQITLSSQVTNRFFLRFRLEYFVGPNASGDETMLVRFYNNDGTNGAPQTLLYAMPQPVNLVTGYNSVIIEGLAIQMPDSFTWTVEFKGVTQGEVVGLLFYNPPSIGMAYDDYWEKESNLWVLKKVYGSPANFGVLIQALVAGAGPPDLPAAAVPQLVIPPPQIYAAP